MQAKKKNPLPVPMRFLYDIVLLALNNHYFLNNISIGIRPFDFDIKCFLKSYFIYAFIVFAKQNIINLKSNDCSNLKTFIKIPQRHCNFLLIFQMILFNPRTLNTTCTFTIAHFYATNFILFYLFQFFFLKIIKRVE